MKKNKIQGRSEKGYTLVLVALGLTGLMGALGIAFDVGYLEYTQRQMQTAADAAAQAGAEEIVRGDTTGLVAAADTDSASNGFTNGTNNVTVTINNPPQSGYYLGSNYAVEAIISRSVPTFFMRVLNTDSATVTARAVAAQVSSPNCVFALDPTAADAIEASNDAQVVVGCGIISDSSNSKAVYSTGSASISGTAVNIVGSYYTDNNGHISPTPKTSVLPLSDPLGAVPAPTVGSCTYTNYPPQNGGSHVTLSPGTYCNGLNVTNGMTAVFNPGTYIIVGGGMHFAGGTTETGTGVTFYVTKNSTYSFAPVVMDNGVNVTLSAPTSGTYLGMLLFQDRSITTANTSNSATQLQGGATMALSGALYFPGTQFTVANGTNTSASYTIIVADTIVFAGGMNLSANYTGLQGGSPIQVATLGE